MQFYKTIHKYYDYIFPLNPHQVRFVEEEIPIDSEILDVGCATGNLAIELAKSGYKVRAIDLDESMIQAAKLKSKNTNIRFSVANMLSLDKEFSPCSFSGITCFGNTLVHLENKDLIPDFMQSAYEVLKNKGKLLIQILNYDYILNEKLTELPLIDNEKVKFTRHYEYTDKGLIKFSTKLITKPDGSITENEVLLLPLTQSELQLLLQKAGFCNIRFFHNFNKNIQAYSNLPLIVVAEK